MDGFQNQLKNYLPENGLELEYKAQMLNLIDKKSDLAFTRQSLKAHFTASAWLINPKKNEVLLLKHKKLNKWLQPGGHADGEFNLEKVAKKEVAEETSLTKLNSFKPGIFDIDIHLIPEYKEVKAHYHYDVRFAFVVENVACTEINNESTSFKWVKLNEIKELTDNTSILRMVRKTQEIFNKQ